MPQCGPSGRLGTVWLSGPSLSDEALNRRSNYALWGGGGGFPTLAVSFLGVPIIRVIVFGKNSRGSPVLGNGPISFEVLEQPRVCGVPRQARSLLQQFCGGGGGGLGFRV